jgi:hypothetical protein
VKTKTCPALFSLRKQAFISGRIGSKRLKKKGVSPKTKEAKPTVINTVFLDLRTSIEDCEKVIKVFKKLGYTTYYNAKTKTIKTTAPKTKIKKLSKIYDCIQSFSLKESDSHPEAQ